MFDIKKKIIAIAVICAMSLSMAACSDKKNGSTTAGIKTATLSSEEAAQLMEQDLVIEEFTESTDTAQDPVESDSSSSSDGNTGNSSSSDSGNSVDQSSFDANEVMNATDMVIVPGGEVSGNSESSGNNSSDNDNNSSSDDNKSNNNSTENNNNTSSNIIGEGSNASQQPEIQGTKKLQQAYWMNLSGDYVFDGEFITVTFKIKDTTANGTYPITIDWLDFANTKATSIKATGINGSVVVGGNATANTFKNDGSFEVMADNVSGNPGDTVTVSIRFNKNPGICASVLRFGYDSDALEYVSGTKGSDFLDALDNQNV